MGVLLVAVAFAWEIRGPGGTATSSQIEAASVFSSATLPAAKVTTDPSALRRVATDTLRYLRAHPDDPAQVTLFTELGVTGDRLLRTLELVAAASDTELVDPAWLAARFDYYRWTPPPGGRTAKLGLAPGELRLTRYLVVQVDGREAPDATYTEAIYADPGEPARSRYTRREVMEGAYDKGGATPLAWLREEHVHDAIMQGSVQVTFPGNVSRLYNVEASNGIPYEGGKRGRDQDRYWYFAEVSAPRGYGVAGGDHVLLEAGVAVAGDVYNLGLGRLVAVQHSSNAGPVLRLAVIADTGGAFQPNLSQLDWFGGAFPTHAALYAAWKDIPDRVSAGVLVAR